MLPAALTGTALHEAVHSLAHGSFYAFLENPAQKVSSDLVSVLAEGVTAFFTDCVLRDEGFDNFNDAYRDQKKKAEKLIGGLQTNQFDASGPATLNLLLYYPRRDTKAYA